jgi:hypothetical protein
MTAPQLEGPKSPDQQPQVADTNGISLTAQQQADLNDPEKQAHFLSEFNEQMRRLYCPGCGEG